MDRHDWIVLGCILLTIGTFAGMALIEWREDSSTTMEKWGG